MDPQFEKAPGLHLPQPSGTEGSFPRMQYEETNRPAEASPVIPEVQGVISQPPAAAIPVPTLPPASVSNAVADDQIQHTSTQLDDDQADALDKEWVNKAKFIVEQTKADPFAQSKEISKVRADYLKIRYNKHIKLSQDQSL